MKISEEKRNCIIQLIDSGLLAKKITCSGDIASSYCNGPGTSLRGMFPVHWMLHWDMTATTHDTMASSVQYMELIQERLVSIASQCTQEIDLQQNFHVLQKLGNGGYGSVLMVKDKKTGQEMALKVLNRNKITEFAFLMEFAMTYFLSFHPNIIRPFGVPYKTGDLFAFPLELAIGDLASFILPHTGLPEDIVKRCVVQISGALEFIHRIGLVHLDIKPENILVFDKDFHCIKVTDFGFSCFKGSKMKIGFGTKSFMAPEMRQLKDTLLVDYSLDVWALGIVLYHLLTGDFPWQSAVFTDNDYCNFVEWQKSVEAVGPPSPWRKFPPQVLKMFSGLLAIDYNKRSKSTDVLTFLGECWKE
ncbi:serine/threonine-protein kinase SBK1-like [Anomaloglossus baeobatrachus]|uniref:serine/threonine-protein kinase SBK1-like n=1 Tax=Anomaloglossus baeobatrachus TaxID=238106 RepID=UPI003F4FBDA6